MKILKITATAILVLAISGVALAAGINPPSNLSAIAVSSSQINLSWQDNSDNETGFKIERSPNGISGFSEISQVGANVTTYSNTGLSKNTTYHYRVRAYKKSGSKTTYSSYSNTAYATTFDTAPSAPTNLIATSYGSGTSTPFVFLTWQDNSDNENGFSIERSTNGINFGGIATTSLNAYYYPDYNIATGTSYYYRVRAFNAAGFSNYSNTASTTVQ